MNLWEKKKLVLICLLVSIGIAITFFQLTYSCDEVEIVNRQQTQALPSPVLVSVYISGAVKKPGIYDVPAGMRSIEAIKLAGGITAEAAIHKVNLAKKCKDGMQIHVPLLVLPKTKQQENKTEDSDYAQEIKVQPLTGKTLSLNRTKLKLSAATARELTKLPGVGPALAQAIIAYRTSKGFSCLEDLLKVPGIGPC